MISGRGLGHTGGTLDKLASIPGYDTTPELARCAAVRTAGCAIVGQTANLAPRRQIRGARRDCHHRLPALITASILSRSWPPGWTRW
jgi:thymidine phosphorylase